MHSSHNNINLAILTTDANAYSETFIKAHRDLPFNVFFYSGEVIPNCLENRSLNQNKWVVSLQRRKLAFGHPEKASYSDNEINLMYSFKKNGIQVVLAEYGVVGAAVFSVCKELSLPVLVHFHGYDASVKQVLKRHELSYPEMFSYASSVFSVSNTMSVALVNSGCARHKIVLNPYGPNDDFFNVKPVYKSQHFYGIGRFVDKKAPYYSILAFREVLKIFPGAKLTIGGDGPLLDTCWNLVKLYKMQQSVFLPGAIKKAEWLEYLSNAIAFVQHSVTASNGDMEGTPVAVLEAQAAAIPVIATRHAGIPEVVLDNETGLLVDEHDVKGMAEQMIKILTEPGLSKSLGEAGRKRTAEQFSLQRHLNIIEEKIIEAHNKRHG